MNPSRILARTAGAGLLAGAAGVTYAAGYEVRAFTLREALVPVLPKGAPDLRVLHVSDLHMLPSQEKKQRWLRSLAQLHPDLVINTGDNMSHRAVVPDLLDSFGPLLDVPGIFVFGSNDYFAPAPRNPLRYLLPDNGVRNTHTPRLPFDELGAAFSAHGWRYAGNHRFQMTVHGLEVAVAGVDDPHLDYDDLDAVAGTAPADADLRLGVAHAPYLRVLDQFAADGYELITAGHTHGGQLCLPFGRAIVTNCDLEPARARGLHRHPARSQPGEPHTSWLHVSAGAGTSPYAPVRFCCRPEATLLTLTARA